MKAVIGGVGYRDLSDHSFGPLITDELSRSDLPEGISAHDLSYNPVAVGQWLDAMEAAVRPSRLVLVAAPPRGRRPGAHHVYRWDGRLPDAERVQEAVADAVTGVIHVDNTLIVLAQFGPLPREVFVIEVEPGAEEFGTSFTPAVARKVQVVQELAVSVAVGGAHAESIRTCGLGGPAGPRTNLISGGNDERPGETGSVPFVLPRVTRRL